MWRKADGGWSCLDHEGGAGRHSLGSEGDGFVRFFHFFRIVHEFAEFFGTGFGESRCLGFAWGVEAFYAVVWCRHIKDARAVGFERLGAQCQHSLEAGDGFLNAAS